MFLDRVELWDSEILILIACWRTSSRIRAASYLTHQGCEALHRMGCFAQSRQLDLETKRGALTLLCETGAEMRVASSGSS